MANKSHLYEVMMDLITQLKQHEGYRRLPYKCTEGFDTIGYGRNLETNGIDEEEAEYLLRRDVGKCRAELFSRVGFFSELDSVRQDALVNMAFQLGVGGLLKFKNMMMALNEANYWEASRQALDSRWARQTPNRAKEVALMLETGEY